MNDERYDNGIKQEDSMGKLENYTHVLLKPEMARMRALSKAIGYDDDDIHRPRIGIQNTWSETAAGHVHLKQLTEQVRAGILQAGGVPIEFGGYGGCPISLGENGHRYDTPSRDIMAMDVETCAQLHTVCAAGSIVLSVCLRISVSGNHQNVLFQDEERRGSLCRFQKLRKGLL